MPEGFYVKEFPRDFQNIIRITVKLFVAVTQKKISVQLGKDVSLDLL